MTKDTPEIVQARDAQYRVNSKAHVDRYLASDGASGYDDNPLGATNLLLTTTGRLTGKEYTTPLNFVESDGAYVVIASYAGSDRHPRWYLNLVANPRVTVQILGDRFAAVARTADDEEKKRLWPLLADRLPYFNDYQASTDRDIPLVVLNRRP